MSRHRERQEALEILYSREFHAPDDIQYAEQEIFDHTAAEARALTSERRAYCMYLVQTVGARKEELDRIIGSLAKDWDIQRLNYTEKNIMRLALCEMKYPKEPVPTAVVLNEAVLLAKEYCSSEAARFVNGVLGTYSRMKEE